MTQSMTQLSGATPQMVATPYGELPVIGVWRQCRHTRTGWSAIDERGQRLNLCRPPDERARGPARMPDEDYVVIVRDAVGHEPRDVAGHVPRGVVLIERASKKSSRVDYAHYR
jgi:hypothetical protein